jgi:hypothetical protein
LYGTYADIKSGRRSIVCRPEILGLKKTQALDERLGKMHHLSPYCPFWESFGKMLMFIDVLMDDIIKFLDVNERKDLLNRGFWVSLKTNVQIVGILIEYIYDLMESYLHWPCPLTKRKPP